jgi:hypothetical protein
MTNSNSTRALRGIAAAFLAACLLRCGENVVESPPAFDSPASYFSTARALAVDVSYEPGAEPYAGTGTNGTLTWTMLANNITALVACHDNIDTVAVPFELADMYAMTSQNQAGWSASELRQLADVYRPRASSADTGVFWIAFVNGYFEREGAQDSAVIGNTGTIAIFKDVIERAAATDAVRRFIEQSTLVHEMGHALGLVNNGVPMTTTHEDSAHARHCSDSDCIMYWANEGLADLSQFVQRYLLSGQAVLFCDACRDDVCAYQP